MIYCRLSLKMELTGKPVIVEHTPPNRKGYVTAFVTSFGFAGSVTCDHDNLEETLRLTYASLFKPMTHYLDYLDSSNHFRKTRKKFTSLDEAHDWMVANIATHYNIDIIKVIR